MDPYYIAIDLTSTRLHLFMNGQEIANFPAGVGIPSLPTPTGQFFVAFFAQAPSPGYGAFVMVTSGHSNAITDWEMSGDAIIAIHGALGADAAIGTTGARISHGCVRLHNADLAQLRTGACWHPDQHRDVRARPAHRVSGSAGGLKAEQSVGGPCMTAIDTASASSIRASLDHPIIDADGHIIEHLPALIAHLLDQGIDRGDLHLTLAAIFQPALDTRGMSLEDCVRLRITKSVWWGLPSSALDLATVTAPRLYRKRLDEFGIDYSVVYPSVGIGYNNIRDDDVRVAACRAYNRYVAETFADVRDRIEPAAVIAMNTPAEGVQLLEDAVALGLKTAMIPSYIQRPIPGLADDAPGAAWGWWLDTYGVDSPYDYDSLWARCVALGVSVAGHSGAMGTGTRQSPTNFMFNHTGHFGVAGEALARGLFFGGVTERFPELRVAFLEGGVNWARGLLGDLISRWEKRNGAAVGYYDPANTDRSLLASLLNDYAPELVAKSQSGDTLASFAAEGWPEAATDEFARAGIGRKEQFLDRFIVPYFFGCEADDPLTVGAFRTEENPLGAEFSVLFGSDIGHWDVRNPMEVVPEAYEAVERGLITRDNFRAFVYDNARRFFAGPDPAFFAGTSVA